MSVIFDNECMYKIYRLSDSKSGSAEYSYDYYEFYKDCGWKKLMSSSERYSKEAIEYDFDIEITDDMEVAA